MKKMFDEAATRFTFWKKKVNHLPIPVVVAPKPIYQEYPEEGFSHSVMGDMLSHAEFETNAVSYIWNDNVYSISCRIHIALFTNGKYGLWVETCDSVTESEAYKAYCEDCMEAEFQTQVYGWDPYTKQRFSTDPRDHGPVRPDLEPDLPTQLILNSVPIVGNAYKGTMFSPSGEASFKKLRIICVEKILEGVFKLLSEENETFLCLVTKDSPYACEEYTD